MSRLVSMSYVIHVSFHFFANSYGERGTAIISSVINRIFGSYPNTIAINPLPFKNFSAYVLVPYIAHRLIAEDLSCDLDEAYRVMIESGPLGAQLQYWREEDPVIDEIVYRNHQLGRRQKVRIPSVCESC
jgi:hypothetical protein